MKNEVEAGKEGFIVYEILILHCKFQSLKVDLYYFINTYVVNKYIERDSLSHVGAQVGCKFRGVNCTKLN